ncbi:hypothetical protein [Streptomyces camelliae]|uniref:Uncharacterized protein n=1 Tax=Streptomyces camelliae TaxID=3004093 RepID=A0ABY7PJZ0_9ACTN|nr:hypothetical protein [Streptomyces sp. HUAS 2-6]WBO69536.1 hypothetical protein O1G22_41800 [Streptomyces sp. HUAS 2-6]
MDRDEELLRGRVYGADHEHPGPVPGRRYPELVRPALRRSGPLGLGRRQPLTVRHSVG